MFTTGLLHRLSVYGRPVAQQRSDILSYRPLGLQLQYQNINKLSTRGANGKERPTLANIDRDCVLHCLYTGAHATHWDTEYFNWCA